MFEAVKWVFFDLGSTIMDERLAYAHRFAEMAAAAGLPYQQVHDMAIELYQQNKQGDKELIHALGIARPAWHTEDEVLYGDALRTLARLRTKYKLGVIANQSRGCAERLAAHGVLPYIDLVVASAEEGVSKPDKRIFEIALERGRCKPGEAVMVGDRIDNDIVPAKALGMHTVWVKQGFGKLWRVSREAERADRVAYSLAEVCDCFDIPFDPDREELLRCSK